jgi:hypothetical protein
LQILLNVLLVVLCLKEVEFFLYAVTGFTDCELKGLPRLWWTLKQMNTRTSQGGTAQQRNVTPSPFTSKQALCLFISMKGHTDII